MSQPVVEFLKKRLSFLGSEQVELVYSEAEKVYFECKGALGLTRVDKGVWRIDFFAADDKATRNELIKKAITENDDIEIVTYQRAKHNDKEFWHSKPFWKKLLAV